MSRAALLDGLMLGDGHITKPGRGVNCSLSIVRVSTDIDYQEWTAAQFAECLTPKSLSAYAYKDARTGKTYRSVKLRTGCKPEFTSIRKRWYPDGVKRVPLDLALSSVTVAIWLADDGYVFAASRRSPVVKFATQGFAREEVEVLRCLLIDRYGASVHARADRTVHVAGESARVLLGDVDPVFPPLSRKSRIWRDSELLDIKQPVPPCPRCCSAFVYRHSRTSSGVQRYRCQDCLRSFRATYERSWRDPGVKQG